MQAHYIDPRTGKHYPLTDRRWRSDDGNPMMMSALPGIGRDDIDSRERSIWRYRAALPLHIDSRASMGEGCTPLVEKAWGDLSPALVMWRPGVGFGFQTNCLVPDRIAESVFLLPPLGEGWDGGLRRLKFRRAYSEAGWPPPHPPPAGEGAQLGATFFSFPRWGKVGMGACCA